MSHQIKFRLWNNEGKYYVRDDDNKIASFDMLGIYNYFHSYNEHPNSFSFEQFTYIIDKNGKEIYEGDITALCLMPHHQGVYRFVEKVPNIGDLMDWRDFDCSIRECFDNLVVIGNIRENANLLSETT
jgi:uncharacterized phage protein (TIGR01671 family)